MWIKINLDECTIIPYMLKFIISVYICNSLHNQNLIIDQSQNLNIFHTISMISNHWLLDIHIADLPYNCWSLSGKMDIESGKDLVGILYQTISICPVHPITVKVYISMVFYITLIFKKFTFILCDLPVYIAF